MLLSTVKIKIPVVSQEYVDTSKYFCYALQPIDGNWEFLNSLQFVRDLIVLQSDSWVDSSEIYADWQCAKIIALQCGWEGDICESLEAENPSVFWIPDRDSFKYGFVFKQDNDGTTFVLSPFGLEWLQEWLQLPNKLAFSFLNSKSKFDKLISTNIELANKQLSELNISTFGQIPLKNIGSLYFKRSYGTGIPCVETGRVIASSYPVSDNRWVLIGYVDLPNFVTENRDLYAYHVLWSYDCKLFVHVEYYPDQKNYDLDDSDYIHHLREVDRCQEHLPRLLMCENV